MKKRIISMLLVLVLAFSFVCILASCGGDTSTECAHYDNDGNGRCDECNERIVVRHDCADEDGDGLCDECGEVYIAPEDIIDYPWDKDSLLFQFTDNDNNKELSSGCRRYLAGDLTGLDASAKGDIDTSIENRNKAATAATGISVQYLYWPNNNTDYSWSSCIKRIEEIVTSKSEKGCPDLYVTFIYDLVGASVKGYFANLKGTSRQNGNNYFKFNEIDYNEEVDNGGYMNEWMNSVTLSMDKKYVLASDYFTDMVRAFFIMPIGVGILEQVGPEVNGVDEFGLHDFYDQVWNMEWTYAKLMEYSAAAYADDGVEATSKPWIGDKQIGFAFSKGGVAGSGLMYTTKVRVISQIPNDKGGYDYIYPTENEDLYEWIEAAKNLWTCQGIIQVSGNVDDPAYSQTQWGNSHLTVIRKRFSQGAVLFGDIMMVGALEYSEYQSMRDIGGFGVTVVPLYEYHEGDRYLTQIHNVARPGAIAYNTQKFEQCTAYLNYQSTHSTDILNDYYRDELMYNVAGGDSGTVRMLQYVRDNVRTSFDKAIEDAAAEFSEGGKNGPVGDAKVNVICADTGAVAYGLGRDGLREKYDSNLVLKQDALDNLVDYFKTAAD